MPRPSPGDGRPACLPRRLLLVVDDNVDQADLLAMLLRLKSFEVVTAYSPEQALAAMRSQRFAAVITDHYMLRKTGCAMLAEARAAGLLRQVVTCRCILVAAHVHVHGRDVCG